MIYSWATTSGLGQARASLAGATIGNGVIIGAGAVVSGHVPDYAIVTGNRAEMYRMRFDAGTIAQLNQVAWWDWEIERILANEAAIVGRDIKALLAEAGSA